MLDTYKLGRKGFRYIGFYTQDESVLNCYVTVHHISHLSCELGDKQYCYVDSEKALRNVVARLSQHGTVRAVQLAHNSFCVAWSKSRPKVRTERVLYTDIKGNERNWS